MRPTSFNPTCVPFDEVCLQRLRKASLTSLSSDAQPHHTTMDALKRGTPPLYYGHVGKNVALLALSFLCLPLSAALVLLARVFARLSSASHNVPHPNEKDAAVQRKTILVTGVSMSKGLTIARILNQHTRHRVIGADISSLSPGRFSTAITRYYCLDTPNGDDAEPYVDSILSVIRHESVDLWISCSSVVAAVEDGQVVRLAKAQAAKAGRRFEAIQFNEDEVEKFHEKDKFIEHIASLDLPVPESHRCTSPDEALNVLLRNIDSDATTESNKFIMKPIGVDDRARNAMMTLLPFSSPAETTSYIRGLNISPSNPFQLQQFIRGSEYCTHALVIHGQVKAFTSCPSLELLMHYEPLPAYSALSQEMLAFTERVVAAGGADFTGHLSFDFLVEKSSTDDLKFYPIECNPRAHTAVVLFDQTPELAAAYLSIFDDTTSEAERSKSTVVFPRTPTHSYYWAGHDLVTYLVLPLLDFLTGHASIHDVSAGVTTLWSHLSNWKDGTLTLADPWPFFVLYHVYWPAKFAQALMRGRPWSRINVSTTKMFE
jgi:hypothetical protein